MESTNRATLNVSTRTHQNVRQLSEANCLTLAAFIDVLTSAWDTLDPASRMQAIEDAAQKRKEQAS